MQYTQISMYSTPDIEAADIERFMARIGKIVTNLVCRPVDPILAPHLVVWYGDIVADDDELEEIPNNKKDEEDK